MWSVGAILYEMLFGSPPFKGENHIHLLRVIEATDDTKLQFPTSVVIKSSGQRAQGPKGLIGHRLVSTTLQISVSDTAKSLIRNLLIKDPSKRISFTEFFEHPFLAAAIHTQKSTAHPESIKHYRSYSSASNISVISHEPALSSLISSSTENDSILETLLSEFDQQKPVS